MCLIYLDKPHYFNKGLDCSIETGQEGQPSLKIDTHNHLSITSQGSMSGGLWTIQPRSPKKANSL